MKTNWNLAFNRVASKQFILTPLFIGKYKAVFKDKQEV